MMVPTSEALANGHLFLAVIDDLVKKHHNLRDFAPDPLKSFLEDGKGSAELVAFLSTANAPWSEKGMTPIASQIDKVTGVLKQIPFDQLDYITRRSAVLARPVCAFLIQI
jgi:hypothetical protein